MKKRADVLEWINKAEQDYETAEVMARRRKSPVPDIVGFHAQQCVEKYLKALLVMKKIEFPKTHDLIELLEITLAKEPFLEVFRPDLRLLNPFSVQFRYPGESALIEDAKMALKAMRRLRRFLKEKYSF
ncbi:MAG: HEPN domain-containing protein [Nitrospirae bacterium]|nr:HEPN domain-containing protein [Nitrospirota bacterium]